MNHAVNYATATASQPTESNLPEVNREMNSLADEIKLLDERLVALENRLIPVLSQSLEGSGSEGKTPEPVRVPLAQSIHDETRHVANCNARLASILNRLEI